MIGGGHRAGFGAIIPAAAGAAGAGGANAAPERGDLVLSRLERAIEDIVEGSISTVFRLRVQPAEIGRKLERALMDQRVASTGKTLGPNAFDVALHPDDAAAYAAWNEALGREMEMWLAEVAFARGVAYNRIPEDPLASVTATYML